MEGLILVSDQFLFDGFGVAACLQERSVRLTTAVAVINDLAATASPPRSLSTSWITGAMHYKCNFAETSRCGPSRSGNEAWGARPVR